MSAEFELNQSGYFGKLPAVGDFVSRGLPQSFITPWDTWVQELLLEFRTTSDSTEEFNNNYLGSATIKFALSPGLCGENGWSGVMLPSKDKAGRVFPLTFAHSVPPANSILDWFESNEELLDRALETCLKTRQAGFSLDQFNTEIENLRSQAAPASLSVEEHGPESQDIPEFPDLFGIHVAYAKRGNETFPWHYVTESVLLEAGGSFSMWRFIGESGTQSTVISQGIPAASQATSFINNSWEKSGWKMLIPVALVGEKETIDDNTIEDDDLDSTVESPMFTDTVNDGVSPDVSPAQQEDIPDDNEEFPWD